MTEQEIREGILVLVAGYKKLQVDPTMSGKARADLTEATEELFVNLATQLLVDIHRVADALESISHTSADMLNHRIHR